MQGPVTWTYRTIRKQLQKKKQQTTPTEGPTTPRSKETCPHHPASDTRCEVCAAEKSAARKYRYKLLLLLLPGFFTSSLDLTVVATAMPFIASHFGTLPPFAHSCRAD